MQVHLQFAIADRVIESFLRFLNEILSFLTPSHLLSFDGIGCHHRSSLSFVYFLPLSLSQSSNVNKPSSIQ